jgi:ABC-2 type transport system ATP-binding protein
MDAISIRGLRKEYVPALGLREILTFRWRSERVVALDGLDLDLAAGRVHALVGPNGAGKTTLLKLVAALIEPTTGSVAVGGLDTRTDGPRVRARIGYAVTEGRSFFLRLSGRENLRFFASLHGLSGRERSARIDAVLDRLELSPVADRKVLSYSEGMRQRLGLARALVHEPAVVLLDEIGRGLDPRLRADVHRMIREDLAGARGVTVVMATHDLREVESLADRVHVLANGRLVASGAWSEVVPDVDRVFGMVRDGGAA